MLPVRLRTPNSRQVAWAAVVVAGVALALAGSLALTTVGQARTEATLRAQVAALSAQTREQNSYWRAKLGACELVAAQKAEPAPVGATAKAHRLATSEPAGFDVCARMESADRAVLGALR